MADANPNDGNGNDARAGARAAAVDNIQLNLAANGLNNRGGPQNNVMNMRDRLFHAIYFKVALIYAHIFPKPIQRALEYFILLKALLFFAALVYIHTAFIKNPATCLQHVKDWPRDGVLRVEVIPNLDKQRALFEQAKSENQLVRELQNNYYYGIGPQTKANYNRLKLYQKKLSLSGYNLHPTITYSNNSLIYYFQTEAIKSDKMAKVSDKTAEADSTDDDEQYIVEYSLEYGHLRLSPETRMRLNIPVRRVQLDPMSNKCFGDKISKFLLKELLGYDDLLMASVRVIAEKEDNKGYLRNVITGEHYRFVSMWWAAWSSYPTALMVMIMFTFSISMLLRFSHHQIFVFIVDLLQMLEFNVTARFPIAPLLTVILALVGMEAIMSEFFNDTTTAFYIILIVWVADQYDAICCHTSITKRHWLRFFFLYHFAFYAYHYRFSGQNRSLALISSWLFTQHSMFYFFHHYELPVILQQAQVLIVTQNNQNAPAGNAVAQDQGQLRTILLNRLLRRHFAIQQHRNRRHQRGGTSFMRRLLGVLRRIFLLRGWAAQRVNVGYVRINPVDLGTVAALQVVLDDEPDPNAGPNAGDGGNNDGAPRNIHTARLRIIRPIRTPSIRNAEETVDASTETNGGATGVTSEVVQNNQTQGRRLGSQQQQQQQQQADIQNINNSENRNDSAAAAAAAAGTLPTTNRHVDNQQQQRANTQVQSPSGENKRRVYIAARSFGVKKREATCQTIDLDQLILGMHTPTADMATTSQLANMPETSSATSSASSSPAKIPIVVEPLLNEISKMRNNANTKAYIVKDTDITEAATPAASATTTPSAVTTTTVVAKTAPISEKSNIQKYDN